MENSPLDAPLQILQLPSLDTPVRNPSAIDPERAKIITELACERLTACRTDAGLDSFTADGYWLSPIGRPGTMMATRQIARYEYAGDFLHRQALGGIFLENNWSLGTTARFIRLLSAKHADDLVGSEPFFACMPDKIDDPLDVVLAKQTESYVQDAISRSNLGQVLNESIRVALIEGERPIKLTWTVDQTSYPDSATVLVDGSGQPWLTAKGNYVFEHDRTIDVFVDQFGNFVKALDPKTDLDQNGQPVVPQGAVLETRLQDEPSFVIPQNPNFQLLDDLDITITHRNGLVADGLFAEDFIYPIFVPRLELADIMAHSYDAPIEELAGKYPDYYKNLAKLGKDAKAISIAATGAMSTQGQPLFVSGENVRSDGTRYLINVHETYYRCRVNVNDKHDSWLFIAIDYQNRLPIFIEYLGKMKMKRPPFGLLRGLESVPGRAYGIGVSEKFRDRNLAIDLWFNRLALKSSKSGSVTCYDPEAFEETNNGDEMVIGDTRIYRVRSNANPDHPYGPNHPPVWRMNLNEVDEWTMEILEKMVQSGEVEFGIFSAADGSANDLNASGTATGIKNIERTGNVIQRETENLMAGDITELLDMAVDIVLENMDPNEAKWMPNENAIAMLNQNEIRNLPRDVRLLLTKSKSADGIANAQMIKSTLVEYYGMTPMLQKKVRSSFIQILKDLDVADADDQLHDPTDEEIQAAMQAATQGPKATEALSGKMESLAPNQQDAFAQSLGLPPAQWPAAASVVPPITAMPPPAAQPDLPAA